VRGWTWAVPRRTVQVLSLLFVLYAAVSLHWRNLHVAHNSRRLVGLLRGDLAAWLYGLNQDMLSWFGVPLEVSDGLLGVPWGARLGPLSLTDPLSLAAMISQGVAPPLAMWLSVLLPLGVALVLGKIFCSWLCPARLAFELGGAVRQGLLRLDVPLGELQLPRLGLWVALGTTLFAAGAGIGVFHLVLPYLALSSGLALSAMAGGVSATLVVFGGMVLVDALVAPGQICHSLCPTGALLEFVGCKAPLQLTKAAQDRDCASGCNLCQRVCPYGLFPSRETHQPACDTCGRCTSVCPDGRLTASWSLR
jgi:ferredoxin-type protein NapH